ncbi:hypothetical protein BHM03_00024100 [Ensete ventricosum]|nr:hypothetical protein BHM03_00024100 [Ensete ventricosum]
MSSERGLIHSNDGGKVTAENMAHIQLKEILHIKTLSLFEEKKKETFIDQKVFTSEFGLQNVSSPQLTKSIEPR